MDPVVHAGASTTVVLSSDKAKITRQLVYMGSPCVHANRCCLGAFSVGQMPFFHARTALSQDEKQPLIKRSPRLLFPWSSVSLSDYVEACALPSFFFLSSHLFWSLPREHGA
ncbi:hypothetical protein MRX96_019041 [Rhipicephalus microplus]